MNKWQKQQNREISDFISWLYAYQSLNKKAGRESVFVVVVYAAAAYIYKVRERHSQQQLKNGKKEAKLLSFWAKERKKISTGELFREVKILLLPYRCLVLWYNFSCMLFVVLSCIPVYINVYITHCDWTKLWKSILESKSQTEGRKNIFFFWYTKGLTCLHCNVMCIDYSY